MKKRILVLALAAQMLLFSNGCAIFRRKPKTPPPPPPPAVAAPVPEPKPSEPVIVEPQFPPPVVEIPKPAPQPEPVPPKFPEPPKPKPRRKTVRRPAPVVPQPETKPEPPAQPPAPPPRLDEVLGADQRTDLLAQLDGNVTEARRILGSLSGRSLTREQSEAAARARAFIEQALERKDSDIGTAVELSRRGLLLARDLEGIAR